MDASPDVLAEHVRAKRVAVDNDLELLRVRLQQADPRRIDTGRVARVGVPLVAGSAALWMFSRRRRPLSSLDHLLVFGLDDMYRSEQQLVPALEHMAALAGHPELRRAFEQHAIETGAQIERLHRVYRSVRARPRKGISPTMSAVMAESESVLKRTRDADVRDAWLIAMAQRVEHIEIAAYGTLRTYAQTLGYTYAAQLLQQTLEEERAADEKLTLLARRFVNPETIRGRDAEAVAVP
jgi:ferritin-like metal-binding protein YciE